MAVKDFFEQISHLAISALSHSQENNGEDNRKICHEDPLFFGSQEVGRHLKEFNGSQHKWHLDKGSSRVDEGYSIGISIGAEQQY